MALGKIMNIKTTAKLILLCLSTFIYSQPSNDQILSDFKEWKFSESENSRIIKTRLKDVLSPNEVDNSGSIKAFSEDLFDYTISQEAHTHLCDIDNDGINEICTLILEGSGRYPYFYILKRDFKETKYKVLTMVEQNITPLVILNNIFVVESVREFDSGRFSKYEIYKIQSDLSLVSLTQINVIYSYDIPQIISACIDSDTINNISHQKYDKLGVIEKDINSFSVTVGNFTIIAKIDYTTVGYSPNTLNIELYELGELANKYDCIWGFNIKNHDGYTFLSILDMDDKNRIAAIENFRLTILRLDDRQIVFSEYVVANETYLVNL